MEHTKERWGFIDSGFCSPAYNMALDEKLLEWHSEGKIPPVVRFYGWEPAALSIGYFQKAHQEINIEKVREQGLGFVRRSTGGRAVLHEHELTYSVIVNEEHKKMPKSIIEAYKVISEGILEGFRGLGFHAYFAVPETAEDRRKLKSPDSSICFDASSWYELVVEGRKIAGSAQTRQKGVILQHGSILLELDREKLFSLFRYQDAEKKAGMLKAFKEKAVAINDLSDRGIHMDEAKAAFRRGFADGLQVELADMELTENQIRDARSLSKEKYEKDEWNFMR